MSENVKRQTTTAALVLGAVIFGIVLAGGLDLTPAARSEAARESQVEMPQAGAPVLPSFADLAERASIAVVSIDASSFESAEEHRRSQPFDFFMRPRGPERGDEDREFRRDSGGSGFLVSADGYVVTNNHVIRGAERLQVRIGDREYDAEVRGADPATDLALLKVESDHDLEYLELGDSESVRPGDWVMAIGSPAGLLNTVTVGVVSAKQRRIGISSETSSFENFIQTDAAINFGNSGGPLINLSGQVIGINTAINYGSENIGFAVPVSTLKAVLPQLRDSGRVRRGFLGMQVTDLVPEAAEAFGLESTDGALVMSLTPDMPAEKGGVEVGDIVLEMDGRAVRNTRELIDYVSAQGPEAEVELEILRNGKKIKREVVLAERPAEGVETAPADEETEGGIEWLGIRYQDLAPGLRAMHRIPDDVAGVWVTAVSPRSPLYDAGVRAQDAVNIISEVNGRPVTSSAEFESIIGEARSGSRLRLYVRRFVNGAEGQPVFAFPAKP
ncbi:MAG: trypsin-like peptidase domain-containing protein [Acidobacteriota bacterium]|nr:trypsin-like peptidase domain-containing protein [Acidobacteriota bacterium]MDH3523398.1 trypsin-like peptidase domain-containing protein [Acidobacteriota bacterium]